MYNLWIRAKQSLYEFGIELHVMGQSEDGRTKTMIKDIVYEVIDPNVYEPPTPIVLKDKAAQQLMDDLWMSGVRPSKELYGSTDKEDIKKHLDDMRRIVFNGITISLDKPDVDKPAPK